MYIFLKKTVLTIIAVGLLWSFQAAATTDHNHEKSMIVDVMQDSESSEKESSELESWKFLNYETSNMKLLKLSTRLKAQDDDSSLGYFPPVPTSPPNV